MNTWRTPVIAAVAAALLVGIVALVVQLDRKSSRDFEDGCRAKGGTIRIAEESDGRRKVRWCSDPTGRMI